jgi:AcrR family transcriptional regulator
VAEKPSSEQETGVDPLRVVRLLWDPPPPPKRGRKPGISLEEIVTAGIRLADAKGVESLSMRQVAAELGVGTMSLYTYVASKAELVELMVDRVFGELRPADGESAWRERVRRLAVEHWALYQRHPWILQTNLLRFSLGPNKLDAAETLYAALDGWGVQATELFLVAQAIEWFVQGAARSTLIDQETERLTGESFEDYFGTRMAFWDLYFDPERYPLHTRIWNAGGFDPPAEPFHYGLERLLDAVERRLPE